MARVGITELDVFDVCEKLKRNKINITIENVRRILKTGSNTTISNHINSWRSIAIDRQRKRNSVWYAGYNQALDDMRKSLAALFHVRGTESIS